MANARKTQKELYAEIKAIVEGSKVANVEELVAFIDKKVDQLEHRTDTKKLTSKQVTNAEIKEQIVAYLSGLDGGKVTCTELYANTDFGITSATHASALLKQLVDGGVVTKTYDKKVAKFCIENGGE